MLNPPTTAPLYLYTGVADMRKSFDGLMGLIEQAGMAEQAQVLSGAWFIFRNRRSDRLKILYFDRDGLAIWYKRLERGRFQWPLEASQPGRGASVKIDPGDLAMILAGIDLNSAQRRKRWRRPESAPKAKNPVENPPEFDTTTSNPMVAATNHDATASQQS